MDLLAIIFLQLSSCNYLLSILLFYSYLLLNKKYVRRFLIGKLLIKEGFSRNDKFNDRKIRDEK